MARTRDRKARLEAVEQGDPRGNPADPRFQPADGVAARCEHDRPGVPEPCGGRRRRDGRRSRREDRSHDGCHHGSDRSARTRGLVERRKDDTDRRKVLVVEKSATWRAHPSSGLMRKTVAGVLARYDDKQLAFLERALSDLCEAGKTVLASMGADAKAEASASTRRRGSRFE